MLQPQSSKFQDRSRSPPGWSWALGGPLWAAGPHHRRGRHRGDRCAAAAAAALPPQSTAAAVGRPAAVRHRRRWRAPAPPLHGWPAGSSGPQLHVQQCPAGCMVGRRGVGFVTATCLCGMPPGRRRGGALKPSSFLRASSSSLCTNHAGMMPGRRTMHRLQVLNGLAAAAAARTWPTPRRWTPRRPAAAWPAAPAAAPPPPRPAHRPSGVPCLKTAGREAGETGGAG